MAYPPHTLAPDPQQKELALQPPRPDYAPPAPAGQRHSAPFHCVVCGSVHMNAADRFRCVEGQ